MVHSNTARNSAKKKVPGRPFTKGDPRINRKGRPKSFDALRQLAQQIAHEKARNKSGVVVIDGHSVTVAEAILRKWASSSKPVLQQQFIAVAFGKVPQPVDVTSGGKAITRVSWDTEDANDDN